MKFSEAIRAGIPILEDLGLEQIRGDYADNRGCCATGIALLGTGETFDNLRTNLAYDGIDYVLDDAIPDHNTIIPIGLQPPTIKSTIDLDLLGLAITLNDEYCWPATAIADYFESIGR